MTRRAGRIFSALAIVISAGVAFGHPADAEPTVTRLSGPDRYATAAEVSEASFDPGVLLAFVATGENFPDALAGTPAAAKSGGPILLTQRTTLPAATRAELDRLDPSGIVVLGGPTAVSDAVVAELAQLTAGPVNRIAGDDRYATAAQVAQIAFPDPVDTIYVATGQAFPDALSGGAAAGVDGPVLLVQRDAVPSATAAQLDRLNPTDIVLLGGTSAVSAEVATQLDTFGADVTRLMGADRYLTSVEVSKAVFEPGVARAYLATGANFPDALAGGSPAARTPGPVLLVQPTCIPEAVNAEITRLDPTALVILGGETTLSADIATRTVCPIPPTTFGAGTLTVGSDVPPGTYRTRAPGGSCTWQRLAGFAGAGDVIGSHGPSTSHQIVTIKPTDVGFFSSGCGTWTSDLSPLDDTPTSVGDGTWFVGPEMTPGLWNASGGGSCQWARLSGFGGEPSDLISQGGSTLLVTIADDVVGFFTSGCGTWTKPLPL